MAKSSINLKDPEFKIKGNMFILNARETPRLKQGKSRKVNKNRWRSGEQ